MDNTTVSYVINYSDGNSYPEEHEWYHIIVTSSDPDVLEVGAGAGGKLALSPVGVGTATVSFTRTFSSEYVWLDTPAFASDTLVVTVN
jgi:hypothetical protein